MFTRFPRLCAGLAMALALSAPALADTAAPVAAPAGTLEAVEANPPLHPALWLVRDRDTTIWLFGTVHLLRPGMNWLNGPVAQALNGSDTLVTEILDVEGGGLELQKSLLDRALLPKGQSLRALMTRDQRAAYEALLTREGIKPEAFDQYKPWYPTLLLSMLPLMKMGMVPNAGAEVKLATAYGDRPRDALETVDFQLGLFDGLPQDAQLSYLATTVEHYDEVGPEMDKLIAAWGKGDTDAIASAMSAEQDTPEVNQALLVNRNKAWAKWIEARLAKPGSVFIAVGAGHLAGIDSVQRQLAADGVKSERVQ